MLTASDSYQQCPKKENVCAVVVSHFPEGDFCSRLGQIQGQVAHVAVVDNSSSEETTKALDAVQTELGITVIRNQANLGIATALNQGTTWAKEKGYAWCLLFDQDTTPSPSMLQKLTEIYNQFPSKERLAVLGSNYRAEAVPVARALESQPWLVRKTVITSGSLVSLSALDRIGPFRDEFFIDCVDFDFCLRARSLGFEVVEAVEPTMTHCIGFPTRHRLLWSHREVFNHRPFRWYYKTRNNMVLFGEYLWKDPAWVIEAVCARILESVLMLLFENSKLLKLRYMSAGFCDGVFGRLGKNAG